MKKRMLLWVLFPLACMMLGCHEQMEINQEGLLVPKTVVDDPNLPAIAVNNTLLHAEAFGQPDSALVLVLHGGPGNDYRYLLNCQELADSGYRVIFYDQRGSGLSKRHPKTELSMNNMLADLGAVIAHYTTVPNQKVFLLGHSWGAMLATAYINENPSQISGAILCEPGGFVWKDIKDYVNRSRQINFVDEGTNDFLYLDQFLSGDEDDHAIWDYKFAILSGAGLENPNGSNDFIPYWRFGAITNKTLFEDGELTQPNWTTHLSGYNTPVLFMYSENNTAYGYNHAVHVSSAYPHVQLEEILGENHVMLSTPAGWSKSKPLIANYLNSLN